MQAKLEHRRQGMSLHPLPGVLPYVIFNAAWVLFYYYPNNEPPHPEIVDWDSIQGLANH